MRGKTYHFEYGLTGPYTITEDQQREIKHIARKLNARLIKETHREMPEERVEELIEKSYEEGGRELLDDGEGKKFFDEAYFHYPEDPLDAFLGKTVTTREATGSLVFEYVKELSKDIPGLWWLNYNNEVFRFIKDGKGHGLADCRSTQSCRKFIEEVIQAGWEPMAIVDSINSPLPEETVAAIVDVLKEQDHIELWGTAALVLEKSALESAEKHLLELVRNPGVADRPKLLAMGILAAQGTPITDEMMDFIKDPYPVFEETLTELGQFMEDPKAYPVLLSSIEDLPKDVLPGFILNLLERRDIDSHPFIGYIYHAGSDSVRWAVEEAAESHPGLKEELDKYVLDQSTVMEMLDPIDEKMGELLDIFSALNTPRPRKKKSWKKKEKKNDHDQRTLTEFAPVGREALEKPAEALEAVSIPLVELTTPDKTPVDVREMDKYFHIYFPMEVTVMNRWAEKPGLKDRNVLSAYRKLKKKGFEGHKKESLEAEISENLKMALAARRQKGDADYTLGEIKSCLNYLIKLVKQHESPSGSGYLQWVETFLGGSMPVTEKEIKEYIEKYESQKAGW